MPYLTFKTTSFLFGVRHDGESRYWFRRVGPLMGKVAITIEDAPDEAERCRRYDAMIVEANRTHDAVLPPPDAAPGDPAEEAVGSLNERLSDRSLEQ